MNTNISKYLSYILRHKPDSIGLALDSNGWLSIDDLISHTKDHQLSHELLKVIVETNDKQRFIISDDGLMIKANQGHSLEVDLQLDPSIPPNILYHGTATRFISSIEKQGLTKQNRHHVHLSESTLVAKAVGKRYGAVVLLSIDAKNMYEHGATFYKTKNNVWLVDVVPYEFINNVAL